ncbi:MAG: aminotransferase class I/II-fold pyridoxal phosphate-dependent enzyme [Oscillospiraceae bacterium]|nr:aminotransferase class I/II-fold pyridoxal phosphate-dependent enzyme [Oscillospiraceae bacterium]
MNTPIYDFVKNYAEKNMVRAHMPGHKGAAEGNPISLAYPYDIPEINGADALFEAEGIIAESEKNAAELFGTQRTCYSAGGSTLCIQAMLAAVCKEGDTVVAARNSHKAFLNSCILLGLDPVWVYPEFSDGSVIAGKITPSAVENGIKSAGNPSCVYITSPDYLGNIADVKAIADICHSYGVPLLVDNAHGAHLAFLKENIHPIKLGADMCCDSAHKTLPVLTGGAYLHIGNSRFADKAKSAMSLFGSSSPSYLIMQSLDLCNKYIAESFRAELEVTCEKVSELKERLKDVYSVCKSEPLKLALYTLPNGRTGNETAEYLRANGIEPEYSDETHVMMMFSPQNGDDDFERVYNTLSSMPMPRIRLCPPDFKLTPLEKALTPREAWFAESEMIPADECEGRICAKSRTVCPPCVPVAAGGEVFDLNSIKILKMYSISEVNVVK